MWNLLRILWVIKDWQKYNNPPFTNSVNSHVMPRMALHECNHVNVQKYILSPNYGHYFWSQKSDMKIQRIQ